MVWAYIQIGSLVAIAALVVYIGVSDAKLTKKNKERFGSNS